MKYKKYYSRPKKLQQGGLATFSPNVNLGEAQLAARPGFDLQPLGQSSIVAPSAQPFQNTFSIENAARNTLLNERRFDLQKDEFEYKIIQDVNSQFDKLFDSVSKGTAELTDPNSQYYLPLYGELAIDHNNQISGLQKQATDLAMSGDYQGAASLLGNASNILGGSSQHQNALFNSKFLNALSNVKTGKNLKTGQAIDGNLALDARIDLEQWLKEDPSRNANDYFATEKGRKYRAALDTGFVYDQAGAVDKIDSVIGVGTNQEYLESVLAVTKGNPELHRMYTELKKNGTLDPESQGQLLWQMDDTRAFLRTQGVTDGVSAAEYVKGRVAGTPLEESSVTNLTKIAGELEKRTPTTVTYGGKEYELTKENAEVFNLAVAKGDMELANKIIGLKTGAALDSQLQAQKQAGKLEEIAAKGDGSKNSTVTYKYELPDGRVAGIPDARTKEIVKNSNGNFTSGDVEKAAEVIINLKEGTSDDDALKEIQKVNKNFLESDLQSIRNNIEYKATPQNTNTSITGTLPDSFLNAIDVTEGQGNYNTLFSNAQSQEGNPFNGIDVTQYTVNDLLEFSNPQGGEGSYGQWVAENRLDRKGTVATPMGRYQLTHTKVKEALEQGIITEEDQFTPEVQDRIAENIARNAVQGKSKEEARKALRGVWDGFNNKKITNDVLDSIIDDLQGLPKDKAPNVIEELTKQGGTGFYVTEAIEGEPKLNYVDGNGQAQILDIEDKEVYEKTIKILENKDSKPLTKEEAQKQFGF